MLLTDFGAAGLGVAILGACASSSSDDSADTTAGTEPSGIDPATTAPSATDPATTAVPGTGTPPTEAPATDPPTTDADDAPLEWQHVSFGFVSAYVLVRGNEAAVVDTGTSGNSSAIFDGLTALGSSWSDVRHVVLTHKHGDHVGGLEEVLAEASAATVYAGEGDIASIQSTQPLQSVGDGDEIFGLGVLDTPGHTPGSISLFDTGTGLLVAGDAINGDGAGGLTGANPDFSDDMGLAADSIAKLAALDAQVAAFGHGGPPVEDDVMAQLAAVATG